MMGENVQHYAPIGSGTFTLQATKHACISLVVTNAMQKYGTSDSFLNTQKGGKSYLQISPTLVFDVNSTVIPFNGKCF